MRVHGLAAFPLAFALGCTRYAPSSEPAPEASAAVTPVGAPEMVAPILAVGQVAPDFIGSDQNGNTLRLSDLRGHFVVVYFYPKDETPGCTREACAFRDTWPDFEKKGVFIIGISSDTSDSQKSFAKNHQLPFALVSDPGGDIAAKYGVPVDKADGHISRQSFIVAPDGTLRKIYRRVDVSVHAQQIAKDTES